MRRIIEANRRWNNKDIYKSMYVVIVSFLCVHFLLCVFTSIRAIWIHRSLTLYCSVCFFFQICLVSWHAHCANIVWYAFPRRGSHVPTFDWNLYANFPNILWKSTEKRIEIVRVPFTLVDMSVRYATCDIFIVNWHKYRVDVFIKRWYVVLPTPNAHTRGIYPISSKTVSPSISICRIHIDCVKW